MSAVDGEVEEEEVDEAVAVMTDIPAASKSKASHTLYYKRCI